MTPLPPLRVLFVHQSADLYGSDRVVLELATAVAAAGGEPVVVLPGGGPLVAALQGRGIETHAVQPLQVLKLTRALMTPAGLLRLLRAVPGALAAIDACVGGRRIDVVHSNTLAVLGGAAWARRRRVKHLWHLHEMVERPAVAARLFPWLVSRLADRIVCNSRATQQWLLGHQPALSSRADVVWNGVPEAGYREDTVQALRRTFRPGGRPHAVGLVGRINRMKGHHLLLDAAETLHAQGCTDFSIVFIGSPPPGQDHHLDTLRRRVDASPVADRVVFAGFVPDPAAAYAALDIVCAPSTEAEAFGLVAVEGMAAARPVIAARIGGLPEVVVHGETGLLHVAGDADGLASCLADLLSNAPRRTVLGRAGRARFEREFTQQAMNARFLALVGALGARPA